MGVLSIIVVLKLRAWDRILFIASIQARVWNYTGPYGFGDMDMLEVGHSGLTLPEQRTHFNLWALSKSPLLIGAHVLPPG